MGISGFEDDIKGIRNLIDLALSSSLSSPPHFLFTSSPAVLHSTCRPLRSSTLTHYLFIEYPGPGPVLEAATNVETALGTGYGESKWVSEEILAISRVETNLRPVIVRVGQVAGCVNGYWKPSEWIPSIIRSVELTGCLPSLDQVSRPRTYSRIELITPIFRTFVYSQQRQLLLRLWTCDHPRRSTCTYLTRTQLPGTQ